MRTERVSASHSGTVGQKPSTISGRPGGFPIETLSLALAPGTLSVFPQLRRLIEIIYEKAKFSGPVLRKTECKGLLWSAIAKDHDSMTASEVEILHLDAFSVRPSDRLHRINLHGKSSGLAH